MHASKKETKMEQILGIEERERRREGIVPERGCDAVLRKNLA